jgi:hypothetical protein
MKNYALALYLRFLFPAAIIPKLPMKKELEK